MNAPPAILAILNPRTRPALPVSAPPLPANFHLWPRAMQERYRRHALAGLG
jgi:hypothetical protein